MKRLTKNTNRRGGATIAALLTVVILMGIAGAMLSMTLGSSKERNAAGTRLRAFTAANSAVAHTIANMDAGIDTGMDPVAAAVGNVNTVDVTGMMTKSAALSAKVEKAVRLNDSTYWSNVVDNANGTFTINATGTSSGVTQAIRVIVQEQSGGVFNNAVFAGNSDNDPLYTLDFGGAGGQADFITGDVFSGGSVLVSDDATITGSIRAGESIVGAAGESNVSQPILNLDSMNYEATADYDVAAMFAADGTSESSSDASGTAIQLPESSPAHIFRMNPDDRQSDIDGTVKNDYFLEDPYESASGDPMANGDNAHRISLSGTNGAPGESSNKKVFYIDGNLWIHNRNALSLALYGTGAEGVQVTFVVKGNIYMSDNLFYENTAKDGVAFIAMKDPLENDSGNIYFGDPVFGTLKEMNAYMFAENNFIDTNLDASGSAIVKLNGNMTAGNQVLIDRDYDSSHTKMDVTFDDRVSTGALVLPGLPSVLLDEGNGFQVLSWHRVSID